MAQMLMVGAAEAAGRGVNPAAGEALAEAAARLRQLLGAHTEEGAHARGLRKSKGGTIDAGEKAVLPAAAAHVQPTLAGLQDMIQHILQTSAEEAQQQPAGERPTQPKA